MKITFFGAAGEVTGSQHLIETDTLRVQLDCGFFQGHRAEARKKNEQFHCQPKTPGAMLTALGEHVLQARQLGSHAHAKPWAWHPTSFRIRHATPPSVAARWKLSTSMTRR